MNRQNRLLAIYHKYCKVNICQFVIFLPTLCYQCQNDSDFPSSSSVIKVEVQGIIILHISSKTNLHSSTRYHASWGTWHLQTFQDCHDSVKIGSNLWQGQHIYSLGGLKPQLPSNYSSCYFYIAYYSFICNVYWLFQTAC